MAIALHILFMGDWWSELFESITATINDFWVWLQRVLVFVIGLYIGIWCLRLVGALWLSRIMMKGYSKVVSFVLPALAEFMYSHFESDEEKKKREEDEKKAAAEAKKKAIEDERKAEEEKRRIHLEAVRRATDELREATRVFNEAKKN